MIRLLRNIHNRRPIFWTVIAFIFVVAMAATLSIWWNYLLVQNHRILREMTAAASAAEREASPIPLALLMVLGLACSVAMVTGLIYMFLRLIRAVQINVAQSQFIAAVTHELRSPVASLQLMLDTVRDPTTPPERRKEFENIMAADLARLRTLVDQVLETARLENFAVLPPTQPVALNQLLESCVKSFESRLRTSSSQLRFDELPRDLAVKADPKLLSTAILNVLDNAIKYSAGAADILVRARDHGRMIFIEIEDKGIGIERRELKRVFKRFYRASDPASREKPGTGLGLYFARLALRAQGGNITVQSPGLGMGATFRIEVPKT